MIQLIDINHSFGANQVLKNLSFDVKPGHMTGFVGANGAGKTTTMRVLLGVLTPDSGRVEVNGAPITSQFRRSIGYMPEERGLYPKMKVIDQLVYLAKLRGMNTAPARKKAMGILEKLNLDERAESTLEELSLGNQQRVQIAAALVHEPVALVLDEPFSGLDPLAVETTLEVLREVAQTGAPVLFSSHQLEVVEKLCDDIVVISDGQVRAQGTREELLAQAGRPEWEIRANTDMGWVRDMGVEVTEFANQFARFYAATPQEAGRVLAQAQERGTVTSFGPVTLHLHEILKESLV